MEILNRIYFEDKIRKIKKEDRRNFLLTFFTCKNLIFRIACFLILTLICGLVFFLLRHDSLVNNWEGLVFNRGIAYGVGDDWPIWVGYFIKILPFIILLFLVFTVNEWYLQISINLIIINSLFNIIDKGLVDTYNGVEYYDTVVDNIKWVSFGFVSNIADILIIIGVIATAISYIYLIYIWYRKKEKDKENEDNPDNNIPTI